MNMISEAKNLSLITTGSIFLALGIVLFIIPGQITTGGTPGMAVILHYITGLPTGVLMTAVNAPLLLAGYKMLGKGFALRTIVAIITSSAFIDIFMQVLSHSITESTMLNTLYGGIAIGAGVGTILKGNASAGGSTIIAKLVGGKTSIKPGQTIMLLDLLIITASGFIFNDIEKALWSLISIYVTGRIIDMILTGASTERIVNITSRRMEELAELIKENIGIYGTIMTGISLEQGKEKQIIFLVVETRKLNLLRSLIKDFDPEAFMVVMEAKELQGRGHGL